MFKLITLTLLLITSVIAQTISIAAPAPSKTIWFGDSVVVEVTVPVSSSLAWQIAIDLLTKLGPFQGSSSYWYPVGGCHRDQRLWYYMPTHRRVIGNNCVRRPSEPYQQRGYRPIPELHHYGSRVARVI